MFSSDFKRVESDWVASHVHQKEQMEWTNEETLRLLKAVEAFGDHWDDVATFVGTKDAEECLRHFVRLPIEESYLSNHNQSSQVVPEVLEDLPVHRTSVPQGPFSGTTNPVMSMIAFLASESSLIG
eukprot:TRINITY_DN8802_c0_g1_i3.p1 TRINITY_DN8802_c0_g1~~TRINITY_DN8802_c0_g1_i3.p1  ORF type:complete len:126 (-),score=31.92 TRINITY_DN8802_c0_g1_i3:40-417(-)